MDRRLCAVCQSWTRNSFNPMWMFLDSAVRITSSYPFENQHPVQSRLIGPDVSSIGRALVWPHQVQDTRKHRSSCQCCWTLPIYSFCNLDLNGDGNTTSEGGSVKRLIWLNLFISGQQQEKVRKTQTSYIGLDSSCIWTFDQATPPVMQWRCLIETPQKWFVYEPMRQHILVKHH